MPRTSPADKTAETGTAQPAAAVASSLKFEQALAELEQIVQNMEAGRLPLEESIAAYRRGSELLKHCQQQLSDAERKIQVFENGTLRDFETTNGETR
jgi:exodeoxyribonuclease VII small subunit